MNKKTAKLKKTIKKVNNLCKRKSYPPTLLNYLYLVTYGMISAYGPHYSKLIYSAIEDNEIILGIEKALIEHSYEDKTKINPIFILELIVDEINRFLTSVKRNFFYLEVINTLQTEDIIKEILSLNYHKVKHTGIVSILEELSSLSPETYASTRLANETALYRDLYNIPTYKKFINKNTLEGNFDAIINDFDEVIGANAYEEFTTLYDEYNTALKKGKENHWQKDDIEETATLAKEGRKFISLYKEKKYPRMKCA